MSLIFSYSELISLLLSDCPHLFTTRGKALSSDIGSRSCIKKPCLWSSLCCEHELSLTLGVLLQSRVE